VLNCRQIISKNLNIYRMNWILIALLASVPTFWPNFVESPPPAIITSMIPGISGDYSISETSEAYFKGHGLSPSWKLEISPEVISFESEIPGFESFRLAHIEPVKDMNRKSYDGHLNNGQVHIEIIQESCTIEGSNESFAYRLIVEVSHDGDLSPRRLEGCGHYVTDVALTGQWVLTQIMDRPVVMKTIYDKLPSLDIQPGRNSFSGFSGCNNINGRIFSERHLLRFTDIVSTKMSCDNIEIESAFLEALQFSTQFKVDGSQLILSNPISTTLILTRKE
jgi:heat shock protein HslJ